MKTKIVFTGGGTAGHVTPNLALIAYFREKGYALSYIGSSTGIEAEMIQKIDLPFYGIKSGKLRRYFSFKNFLDPLNILCGILQSFVILARLRPRLVFSKGGYVAFPVVFAAWLHRIPVIAHESDLSPGLANRLCFPFVRRICLTFEATAAFFKKKDKVIVTGTPIREQLLQGDRTKGLTRAALTEEKPCLLVIGGSLGADPINRALRAILEPLLQKVQVIHLCGKGKVDEGLLNTKGYHQVPYASEELADFFAAASFVLSRAGANSLYELLALKKPHLLIPLSAKASRGDQIQNAAYFQKKGVSLLLDEAELSPDRLLAALDQLFAEAAVLKERIEALQIESATQRIATLIESTL